MPRDFALLEFLMSRPGEVHSSEELRIHAGRAETETTDEAIRSAFKRIRRAIGDTECSIIQNVRKRGYMLRMNEHSGAPRHT